MIDFVSTFIYFFAIIDPIGTVPVFIRGHQPLSMIFGDSKPEEELRLAERAADTAIYPIAVPSIAGPGAMLAAVLLTEKSRYTLVQQAATTATRLTVLLMTLVAMLLADRIYRLVGVTGASIVSRVMGLILASAATASTLAGIQEYFGI